MKVTETEVRIGHVSGSLCTSSSTKSKKLVVLLHGWPGQKNSFYQRDLAKTIPKVLGFSTYRFDSRNRGASDRVPTPPGRTTAGDSEDISEVIDYFENKGFELYSLISHSRGTYVMLHYLYTTRKRVPCVVNCAGCIYFPTFMKALLEFYGPGFIKNDGVSYAIDYDGKYIREPVPLAEILDLGQYNFRELTSAYKGQVLTVRGSEDLLLPEVDVLNFASMFHGRHTLEVVEGANHFFEGGVIGTEVDKSSGKLKRVKKSYVPQVIDIITNYLLRCSQSDSRL